MARFVECRAVNFVTPREERFRLLVDEVEEYAIFGVGPDGKITTWNNGAERITGYSAAEVVGKPYSMLRAPDERPDDVTGKHELLGVRSQGAIAGFAQSAREVLLAGAIHPRGQSQCRSSTFRANQQCVHLSEPPLHRLYLASQHRWEQPAPRQMRGSSNWPPVSARRSCGCGSQDCWTRRTPRWFQPVATCSGLRRNRPTWNGRLDCQRPGRSAPTCGKFF